MNYYLINEQCLEEDEVNYELRIRDYPIDGSLETRRRALRRLLRESESVEVKQTWYSIEDEYVGIPMKLQQIELAIRNRVGAGCLSRLVHLHKRVRRYRVISYDEREKQKMLLNAVSQMALTYFGVNLDVLGQAVPVMTLVTGPQETNGGPSVPDGHVSGWNRQGELLKQQSMQEDLILFSPMPVDGSNVNFRRHTFPVTGTQNPRSDPLQPILIPQFQQSNPPKVDEVNVNPDTPQFKSSIQVQLSRRPSVPVSAPMPTSTFDINPFEQGSNVGVDPSQARNRPSNRIEHSSPELRDGLSVCGSRGSPALQHQDQTGRKVSLNEYVHVSEIETYIKSCISQILTRDVVDNLADRFNTIGFKEPEVSETPRVWSGEQNEKAGTAKLPFVRPAPSDSTRMPPGGPQYVSQKCGITPTGWLPHFQNVSSSSMVPPVQPIMTPEPFPNPYRKQDISLNQSIPQPTNHSTFMGQPLGAGNPLSNNFNQNQFLRQRLPHQTCNIIEKWPKFSGDGNAVPVVDFLRQIEILSRSYQVSPDELRMHAHMLFKGDAYVWFTAYDDKLDSWATLTTMLKMRYDNPNRDRAIRDDMRNRKQKPNELFSAFLTDIEAMSQRLIRKMSAEEKFDLVVENMKMSYRRRLALQPIQSLDHLAQLCYQFDSLESNMFLTKPTAKPAGLNQILAEEELEEYEEVSEEEDTAVMAVRPKITRKIASKPVESKDNQGADQPLCWNCRSLGHMWRDCTQRKTLFCHICGHGNTTAYQCPQKHNLKPRESVDSKNE
ncbi:uncharacterized protein LOC134284924 [Aedes albopictus]|uniref:CCHC-type domain-containing protein n=1 Tax=Aedes albopictus TaxID=7160 RepID=A0ABM1ZZ53_AEDAL